MARYGYSVVRIDKDKNILNVEKFCFNRTDAAEMCAKLQSEKPGCFFTYTETDIFEIETESEQKVHRDAFNDFTQIAEHIIENEKR